MSDISGSKKVRRQTAVRGDPHYGAVFSATNGIARANL
jgi:hypothetical protein